MNTSSNNYDVVIAGAGPAGTSAAIHLAQRGAHVLLAEQKKFPRAKLCGEFISPECLTHFEQLGVTERWLLPAASANSLLFSQWAQLGVPSEWLPATTPFEPRGMDRLLVQ